MDRLERAGGLNDLLIKAMTTWQSGMWTALPATVVSYDANAQTIEAQPTIQLLRYFRTDPPDGSVKGYDKATRSAPVDLPVLVDVPVVFPGAGGYTMTFPVQKGDEVLIVFSSRCIDGWWANGTDANAKAQPQTDLRMHDLSDGIAILGLRNQKRMLSPAPAASSIQLRSDDGQAIIELAANHVVNVNCANVNVTASGTATIKAAAIKLQNAGSALKKLVNETFLQLFDQHVHQVSSVGAPTGVPKVPSNATNATSVTTAE